MGNGDAPWLMVWARFMRRAQSGGPWCAVFPGLGDRRPPWLAPALPIERCY